MCGPDIQAEPDLQLRETKVTSLVFRGLVFPPPSKGGGCIQGRLKQKQLPAPQGQWSLHSRVGTPEAGWCQNPAILEDSAAGGWRVSPLLCTF